MKTLTFIRATALIVALSASVLGAASVRSFADAPQVCYVTAGGDTSVVIGSGFDRTSRVVVWNPQAGPAALMKYAGDQNGPVALPATPPADARELSPINVANDQVLDVSLPGTTVMWVKTAAGISSPRLVNAPEVWAVTDEEPLPGEQMRIFGRNFCLGYLDSRTTPNRMVVFRSPSTGKTTRAEVADLSEQDWQHTDDHVLAVIVPEGLAPGPYDILVHAADTGGFGWSAPFRVNIEAHHSLSETFSRPDQASEGPAIGSMRVEGAVGDGLHDDTNAIQTALDRAASAGGSVVFLPPGQYAISKTLRIDPGVFLRGAGRQATTIMVSPTAPLTGGLPDVKLTPSLKWQTSYADDWKPYIKDMTPMIWMQTKSGISDLSLIGGPGTKCTIVVATRDWHTISDNVSIVRTSITTSQRNFRVGGYHPYVFGIAVLTATRNFTLEQCYFRCGDPIWMFPARPEHYGATITNNRFEIFPRQSTNNVDFASISHSVIEDNDFIGGSRALGFSRGSNDNWIFNNRINDDGGWANAEEMIMSEYGVSVWAGTCQSASANTIQAQGAHWSAGQFLECSDPVFVFIKLGKGFGQFRRLTANTEDTITIDKPWDIVPDSTSRFCVLMAAYHNLYVNDQTIDCNGRCEFAYGSLVECVIEGLNTRDSEGISSTAIGGGIIAFNDYSYNRLINMSGIHLSEGSYWDDASQKIQGADVGDNRTGDVIGNTIRYNEVMDFREYALNQYGTYWDNNAPAADSAGISVSDGSFNIIDDNYVTKGAVGIRIDGGEGNVIISNRIDDVSTKVRDVGRNTFEPEPGR